MSARTAEEWRRRLRARLGDDADPDVVEELADHAAITYQRARAEGADEDEAAAAALEEIGAWERGAPRRRPGRPPLLETAPADASPFAGAAGDLLHAARALARRPWHSALVALTMAVGIGVTTALYGIAHGVLVSPLPWPDADRLVRLSETRATGTQRWPWLFTNASYRAWADEPGLVDGLAAFRTSTVTLTEAGEAARLRRAEVTASLFDLLGARVVAGSLFTAADEAGGGVMVFSEGLWEERFGRSPDAIGRVVRLDGTPHRIAGVVARGFAFPEPETRAWVPLAVAPSDGQGVQLFSALARLKPGVTPGQAAAEGTARAAHAPRSRLAELALFGAEVVPEIRATPLLESMTAEVRPALLLLLAAVGLLLAAATANAAGLQLVAITARGREIALRAAIGAGRARLARLLLAENVLLGLAGGALGFACAAAGQRALLAALPADFPRLDAIALDAGVAAFATAVSLIAAIAFGLIPILSVGRLRIAEVLLEEGAGTTGGGRRAVRLRAAIATAQVAVACALLSGAIQLGRSFAAQAGADRGYATSGLVVVRVTLPDALFTPERRQLVFDALLPRLSAVPGVERVAYTNAHPLGDTEAFAALTVPPRGEGAEPTTVQTTMRTVSPGYFEVLGRRLVAGRPLDARDVAAAQRAVVVNRTFAKRYLQDPPVGSTLPPPLWKRADWQVVGVVDDARGARLDAPGAAELIVSAAQRPDGLPMGALSLLLRTDRSPGELAPTLRALLREQDAALVPDQIVGMSDLLGGSLAQPRLQAVLVGAFAAAALALAGVGLFGVLAYNVALRKREIGLRMALGARPGDVVRLVTGRALTVTAFGLASGLLLGLAGGRLAASRLYGVSAPDAWSAAGVAAVLVLVSAVAAALPARRAARLDPQRALREG